MKKSVLSILILLILGTNYNFEEAITYDVTQLECYHVTTFHYWALDFTLTNPMMSLACSPSKNRYRITFYIEVYNGSGAPMSVQVEDDIPMGLLSAPALVSPPGTIVETSGDAIIGNEGDTIMWNLPALPVGYKLQYRFSHTV